jgi:hypothetical protein
LPEARELVAHLDELDHADDDAADFAPAPSRSRFDDRGNDGTVSAGRSWVPPKKSAAPARIWRPVEESDRPVEHMPPPAPPKKLGGISFGNDNDDEDLADYMHPDDVPPRDK